MVFAPGWVKLVVGKASRHGTAQQTNDNSLNIQQRSNLTYSILLPKPLRDKMPNTKWDQESHNRRNQPSTPEAKEIVAKNKYPLAWLNPPNMQDDEFPDEPISPAFDPLTLENNYDMFNNYPADYDHSDPCWKEEPDTVERAEQPVQVADSHEGVKGSSPPKNDRVTLIISPLPSLHREKVEMH